MRKSAGIILSLMVLFIAMTALLLCAGEGAWALGRAENGQPSNVLMFPITPTKPPAGAEIIPGGADLGDRIGNLLKEYLTISGRVTVTTVHPSSPMVKRAGGLTEADILGTPTETEAERVERAKKVGAKLGVDAVLLGAVDQYIYDGEAPAVQITLKLYVVEKLDAKEAPVPTGVGGSSPTVKPSKIITEEMLRDAAIRDVALKAASAVLAVNPDDLAKWMKLKGPHKHKGLF